MEPVLSFALALGLLLLSDTMLILMWLCQWFPKFFKLLAIWTYIGGVFCSISPIDHGGDRALVLTVTLALSTIILVLMIIRTHFAER